MLKPDYSIFYTHVFQNFDSLTGDIAYLKGYTSTLSNHSGSQAIVVDIKCDSNYCFCVSELKYSGHSYFYLNQSIYLNNTPLSQLPSGEIGLYLNQTYSYTTFRRFSPVKFPRNTENSQPHLFSNPNAPDNYLYNVLYKLVQKSPGVFWTFDEYSGTYHTILPIDMYISEDFHLYVDINNILASLLDYQNGKTYFYNYSPRLCEYVTAISPNRFELVSDRLPLGSGTVVMYTFDYINTLHNKNLVNLTFELNIPWGDLPSEP